MIDRRKGYGMYYIINLKTASTPSQLKVHKTRNITENKANPFLTPNLGKPLRNSLTQPRSQSKVNIKNTT